MLDARGKPPYAVAADKDVRDAFRRYVANEDALPWDWTAAGVPSALTPEMEAQQAARQARARISESLSSCSAALGTMRCALQLGSSARGGPTPPFCCLASSSSPDLHRGLCIKANRSHIWREARLIAGSEGLQRHASPMSGLLDCCYAAACLLLVANTALTGARRHASPMSGLLELLLCQLMVAITALTGVCRQRRRRR